MTTKFAVQDKARLVERLNAKTFLLTTAEEEEIDQQEKKQSGHNYFPIRDGMKEAKKWLQKIG